MIAQSFSHNGYLLSGTTKNHTVCNQLTPLPQIKLLTAATISQKRPNPNICCSESSVLHTWVLGTLCKAYLAHNTLAWVEQRPVCKVKLQLSISRGQHRLRAAVCRADQPSWWTKASVSTGSPQINTRPPTPRRTQQDLFIAPD